MSILRTSACILLLFQLIACGPTGRSWSAKEKAKISTISLKTDAIPPGAYKNPNASQDFTGAAAAASILYSGNSGGDFGGGAAFGAAAVLVGHIGSKIQQGSFDRRYAASIPGLRRTMPSQIGQSIQRSLQSKLKKDPFIQPRLQPSSQNTIRVKVERLQYLRVASRQGNIHIAPTVIGSYSIELPGKKRPVIKPIVGSGAIHANSPIYFNANPAAARKAWSTAIENFTTQISNDIAVKTGGKQQALIKPKEEPVFKKAEKAPSRLVNGANRNAHRLNSVSNLLFTNRYPYQLPQGANLITRASTKINLEGVELRITASADGKVVAVMPRSMLATTKPSIKGSHAYNAVIKKLGSAGIKVVKERDISSLMGPKGFILELDRDGYTALRRP